MSRDMEELFKEKDYCYAELGKARRAFGDTSTSRACFEQMEKALALVYLYCPEEIQGVVLAVLEEAEGRKLWFEKFWQEQERRE